MTLAEFHSKLKEEGKWDDYVLMQQTQEKAHQKLLEDQRKEAAPVVASLRNKGIAVDSIWDLSEGGKSFAQATPILLEHLKREYPDHVREAILRALATPDARSHWNELVDIFENNTIGLPPSIRYVAALALSGAADDAVLDDVVRLISEKRLGIDRAPLLLVFIRSKSPKAKMMLLELRDDPDLGPEIKKMRRLERQKMTKK